jgi:hypothetical protein
MEGISMEFIWNILKAEKAVITSAPLSVIIIAIIEGCMIWFLVNMFYKSRILSKNDLIQDRDKKISDLFSKLERKPHQEILNCDNKTKSSKQEVIKEEKSLEKPEQDLIDILVIIKDNQGLTIDDLREKMTNKGYSESEFNTAHHTVFQRKWIEYPSKGEDRKERRAIKTLGLDYLRKHETKEVSLKKLLIESSTEILIFVAKCEEEETLIHDILELYRIHYNDKVVVRYEQAKEQGYSDDILDNIYLRPPTLRHMSTIAKKLRVVANKMS